MKAVHYKEKDSTKNKPHYTFSFFDDKDNYIGSYTINGYYIYNIFVDQKMRGKGYCKKIVEHAIKRKKESLFRC